MSDSIIVCSLFTIWTTFRVKVGIDFKSSIVQQERKLYPLILHVWIQAHFFSIYQMPEGRGKSNPTKKIFLTGPKESMDWEVLSSNNGKWLHYVFDQEAPRGTCASRETGFICKRSGCRWKNGACADFVFVLICFDETFSRRRDANELQHQLWWRSIQRATKVCKPNTNIKFVMHTT